MADLYADLTTNEKQRLWWNTIFSLRVQVAPDCDAVVPSETGAIVASMLVYDGCWRAAMAAEVQF